MRRRLLDAVCAVLERVDDPQAAARAACETVRERPGVRLAAVVEETEVRRGSALAVWPEADRMLVAHPECDVALWQLLERGEPSFGPDDCGEAAAGILAATGGSAGLALPIRAGARRVGALLLISEGAPDPADAELFTPLTLALGAVLAGPACRREAEKELQARTLALRERVKELDCLLKVSRISEDPALSIAEKVQRIADVVPPAFYCPGAACARISLEGLVAVAGTFHETPHRLAAPILSQGHALGLVEVFYRDHLRPGRCGPFLEEERALLEMVAERLGRLAESTGAVVLLREREVALRALLDLLPVAVSWGFEDGGRIEHTNRRLVSLLGWSKEDVPTLDDWFRLTCPDPSYRSRVAARWRQAVEEARGTGSIQALQTTMVGKDGVARRVVVEGCLVNGRVLAVFDELECGVEELDES